MTDDNVRRAYLCGHDEEDVLYDSGGPYAIMSWSHHEAREALIRDWPKRMSDYEGFDYYLLPQDAKDKLAEVLGRDLDGDVMAKSEDILAAHAEIERLRERIEELEPAVEDADARVDEAWHEGHKEVNAELCGRIERLREKYDREYKHSTELGNTIDRLTYELAVANRRIEELENRLEVCHERELEQVASGHIITRDQIRAAWKEANATSHLKYQNVTLLRFLEKHFGIVRCKRCGGSTIEATTIDHNMYGEPVCANLPCPACHGEGWVIGGDDDRDRHAEIRSTPLTEKQIENWRRALFDEIGPMAYELTDEQIERERAKMQQVADELAKEYPDE